MNFPEAEQNAMECYKTDEMKHHVKAVFDRINDTQTSTYWLCVAALKQFFETEGRLPLSGILPDMVSTTDYYLSLQQIYIEKAKKDAELMRVLVQ